MAVGRSKGFGLNLPTSKIARNRELHAVYTWYDRVLRILWARGYIWHAYQRALAMDVGLGIGSGYHVGISEMADTADAGRTGTEWLVQATLTGR